MEYFDLWVDPWIPVVMAGGRIVSRLSVREVVGMADDIEDIDLSPVPRMAVLRLLLAVVSSPYSVYEMPLFGDRAFLQSPGLPHAPRSPRAILQMEDDANAALSPNTDPQPCTAADLAQALVTAYFCDRPGLKTRMPGVSISGSRPLCMGMVTAMPCGDTLGDLLKLNRVQGGRWEPWWHRSINYYEPFTGDPVQQLLWPWRRLSVSPEGITIVAGEPLTGATDPWVIGRASIKTVLDLGDMAPSARCDITAVALSQASPIAIRQWTHSPVLEPVT
jgi:hypothetical protein